MMVSDDLLIMTMQLMMVMPMMMMTGTQEEDEEATDKIIRTVQTPKYVHPLRILCGLFVVAKVMPLGSACTLSG